MSEGAKKGLDGRLFALNPESSLPSLFEGPSRFESFDLERLPITCAMTIQNSLTGTRGMEGPWTRRESTKTIPIIILFQNITPSKVLVPDAENRLFMRCALEKERYEIERSFQLISEVSTLKHLLKYAKLGWKRSLVLLDFGSMLQPSGVRETIEEGKM